MKRKISKIALAEENQQGFDRAYRSSGHTDYVRNAVRCSRYVAGDQWEDDIRAELEAQGRPALTINMMLSTINAMIGEQLERKIDVTFTAGATGQESTAFALNYVTRGILKATKFDEVEEFVFADGLISDRGFYDIRMDFTSNINGEVSITGEDGVDIVIDGESRSPDPKDWSQVYVSRWMTIDSICEQYGEEHRKDLQNIGYKHLADSRHFETERRTYGQDDDAAHDEDEATSFIRARVVERQHYKYTEILKFLDPETGDLRQVPFGVSEEDAEEFAQENGYEVIKMRGRRLRMTVSVGHVLLEDDWSIYRSFTIRPFFPYWTRGKPHGPARHLLDSQDLLNKTTSQELHIVNTTANSGWIVEEDSLANMDVEDLETNGSKTGVVIAYKRNHTAPEKIQPNQIPTGIERISQKAALHFREISAVNASMLGTARADQSGKAQEMATSRGQVQLSVVLASLRRSRRMVVEKVLELVQDFYDDTRYYAELDNNVVASTEEKATVAINQPTDDGNILNDVTVGKYGIEIGHRPAGGNAMDDELNKMLMMRSQGIQIPDHFVIKKSPLTDRNEIAEFVKNMTGFGEKTPEQQQLEEATMQHRIQSMENDLALQEAKVDSEIAAAMAAKAKADSLEGYKQAEMEILRLQEQRAASRRDAALRIALAARSDQNQINLNDSRMATQIAMKAMDSMAATESKQQQEGSNGPKE